MEIKVLFAAFVVRVSVIVYILGLSKSCLWIAIESILITLFGLCFNKYSRLIVVFSLASLTGIQFLSVASTNNYLSSLAILNMAEFSVLGNNALIKLSAIMALFLITYIPDFFLNKKYRLFWALAFVIVELLVNKLPIHNIFLTFYKTIPYMYDSSVDGEGKEFLKDNISVGRHEKYAKEGENIILLFQEGESQIVLSEKLTPNAWNLQKRGITFVNYFNHTAATFRGIRGQLISGYQHNGGFYGNATGIGQMDPEKISEQYSNKTESLPSILSSHGYRTVFISPHIKGERLRYLMKATGFKETYSADDYKPGTDNFVTDKELYEFLYKKVKELDHSEQPFLLVTYIVGTHHGLDSPDKKWRNGDSGYLNKFHNSDYWLGNFIRKLEVGGTTKNTTIVYTTDHSTFPTQEYRNIFNSNAKYFVDRIPLTFYKISTKSNKGKRIDAMNRNSLCLTPTVLDYLGMKEEKNHFLGVSLFSNFENEFVRLSVEGDDYFSTESGEVKQIEEDKIDNKIKKKIEDYYDFAG